MEKVTSEMMKAYLKKKGYNPIKGTFNEGAVGCTVTLNGSKEIESKDFTSFKKSDSGFWRVRISKEDYLKLGLIEPQNKDYA